MDGETEEERAWAMRLARAFLAPPGDSSVVSRQSPEESRPVVVLAALVVPLPVPPEARGVGREARGDEEQEDEGDG